ncbi:MAG: glycosyltransferase WbuB [Anaerolineales bacterium]|nr:glycosyltransferase WbuB [Anaerolineales bacterium]
MKILIYGLNFAPELTGIGKYTGEMAAFLAAHEQQVRVVTTPPYYPQWQVAEGYTAWAYRKEEWQGVEVYRCPLWVPRRPSGLTRLLHLSTFALSSLPVMAAQIAWKPALVINTAPAIASTPGAWLAARLAGSRAWLHIQDFELDAALKLNMLTVLNPLAKLFQSLESALLKGFDRVSTISQRMLEHLWQKGVPREKTYYLPNWVDETVIYPLAGESPYRSEWQIPPGQLVILYSGNMGHKHGLEVLVEAARLLQGENDIGFIFCGEGAARPLFEQSASRLPNMRLMPLQPARRLNDLLNLADVHVLPQRADTADLVMPSKLSGMLASGKPVIAAARPGTELAQVVGEVGIVVPPEEANTFAEAICSLARDADRRDVLGKRGRQYILEHWAKQPVLEALLQEIKQT